MKFNEKLVLNAYLISLFGVENFEKLGKNLKTTQLEELDENDNSCFYHALKDNPTSTGRLISDDKLLEYDENIVRHTKTMGRDIKWKYFQYLSLLFVEIYLDKYFDSKEQLLDDLNTYLKEFNGNIGNKKDKIAEYNATELNKLALYSATGSGKTLLLHMNLLQFNHYAKGKIKLNKTVLITPNEGLSGQHLRELQDSNIEAEIFSKDSRKLFESNAVEIIEITKLGEEEGDKTVAVDSFEDNNLVFIDEGHRGSSGEIWKTNRDKLSANGFAFEYSATFAQAISSSTGAKKKELENEYAKAIIFDYSYKYFYKDGYGKDYLILNFEEGSETMKKTYLIASLLSFYQQMKIYARSRNVLKPYHIEKPLMVFVGASVNAVRKCSGKDVSDVIDVLLFIKGFIENREESTATIKRILDGKSGILDAKGVDIFSNKFSFVYGMKLDSSRIFDDILRRVFNASSGRLHLENLKGSDGEIALKIGEYEHFGVINVGDSGKLIKLCKKNDIPVASRDFTRSLFKTINNTTSTITILIGSKKFSEGWSSWRVSTMGLMNVGKKEGSQIIQLFGRGVRLKGYNFCLKRSKEVANKELESKCQAVETLNIFGLKADYMKAFRDYLVEEGVPIDARVEFILPVIYDKKYKTKKLKILDLQKGKDFKRDAKLDLKYDDSGYTNKKVVATLSLYKQVDILESESKTGYKHSLNKAILEEKHLSFVNIDNIFFALQQFKNEKGWSNLNISKDNIKGLLSKKDWYKLEIPSDDMEVNSFKNLVRFETIIIALLKKYMKLFYEYERTKWESKFLEYRELDEKKDRDNLIKSYTIEVESKEEDLIARIEDLKSTLERGVIDAKELSRIAKEGFSVFSLDKHLYNPLIAKEGGETALQIKPIALNEGEKDFVEDLNKYLKENSSTYEDAGIYLLRNQSKVGLSFFTEGNFYPDFIMWIQKGNEQYISFIEPKGLLRLNTKNDPKINLSVTIKEIEKGLNDKSVILNSFIVSVTPYSDIKCAQDTLEQSELEDKNVLFQKDDKSNYIGKMFAKILEK